MSLLFAPACQQQQITEGEKEAQAEKVLPPLHLGAVHQVYPDQGFALLRIIGPMPKGGTILITHPADGSNERIGNLIVSSDFAARNNIIAADIRSGAVMKGDRVFQYRNISKSSDEDNEALHTERPIMDSISDEDVEAMQSVPQTDEESDVLVEQPLPATSAPTPGYTAKQEEPRDMTEPATPPTAPSVPSYLNDIPDDISGWN